MKLLELIKGKKEVTAKELIQAARDLQAKLSALDKEEKALEASASELQLEAAVEGKDNERLKEIQYRRMDLPEKREALQDALDKIKEQLLGLMPAKKEELLQDCDHRQAGLKKSEADIVPKVLHCIAELACYLEVLGAGKADTWSKVLIPGTLFDGIRNLVNGNRDEFIRLLERAKDQVKPYHKVGDIEAQLTVITNERAALMPRAFSIEDVDFWIETGRFPIEPTKLPEPIHPSWPTGQPLLSERKPVAR